MIEEAYSTEVNFIIPSDNVAAALSAINVLFGTRHVTLIGALENYASFHECAEGPATFVLGEHHGSWDEEKEAAIVALGSFANEGSFIRFTDDNGTFWGYRVVDGRLREETGKLVWDLVPLPEKK